MNEKSLTLEELEKDKKKLETNILNMKTQLIRMDGALAYVMDNINKLKEVEEDAG